MISQDILEISVTRAMRDLPLSLLFTCTETMCSHIHTGINSNTNIHINKPPLKNYTGNMLNYEKNLI